MPRNLWHGAAIVACAENDAYCGHDGEGRHRQQEHAYPACSWHRPLPGGLVTGSEDHPICHPAGLLPLVLMTVETLGEAHSYG